FNWHINPGVGYQFTDNITIGVQGGIWSEFGENRSANPTNTAWMRNARETREWQAGAFFRYTKYFGNIFSMYTQLDLSYVSGQNVSEDETRMVDYTANQIVNQVIYNYDYYNGFQAFITPMVAVTVHDGLALNFGMGGLGYRTISYDTPKSPSPQNAVIDQSNFMFNFGNQFSFGITKNFGCCHHKTGNVKPGDDLRPMKMDANDDDE
ncbi:MAG: hypothetical protein KDC07_05990, partial [Chitinophagaceae bacterium]|nr:hypothetical protein [Chitinophagaceae bacterium]